MHYTTILYALLLPLLVRSDCDDSESRSQGTFSGGSSAWEISYPFAPVSSGLLNATSENASLDISVNQGVCRVTYWCGDWVDDETPLTPIDQIPSKNKHFKDGCYGGGTVSCGDKLSLLHVYAWCCGGTIGSGLSNRALNYKDVMDNGGNCP